MSEIKKINYNGTGYDIGSGLTDEAKQALLACFEKVAWVDENGQDYYDALETALYPPVNLVSITAIFSQGSNVIYDNQPLSDLKQYLTVTAHYDDSSTAVVTTYTLSGELEQGTSTITVSYGGKTTTFTVTVTHATTQYTITNNLTNVTNSNAATVINELTSYAAILTPTTDYIMSSVSITMGGTEITSTAYDESDNNISIASVTGNIVITATAIEDAGWTPGVPYSSGDLNMGDNGYRLSTSTGELVSSGNNSDMVSDYLPCHGASVLTGANLLLQNMFYYDQNKAFIIALATHTGIENPYPYPVPRNAYYVRVCSRSASPTVTPYVYDALPVNTPYVLNKHYVFDWGEETETPTENFDSPMIFCYGALTFQTSIYSRSFIYYYDTGGNLLSSFTRASSEAVIEIPSGAQYFKININPANSDNPWFIFLT